MTGKVVGELSTPSLALTPTPDLLFNSSSSDLLLELTSYSPVTELSPGVRADETTMSPSNSSAVEYRPIEVAVAVSLAVGAWQVLSYYTLNFPRQSCIKLNS